MEENEDIKLKINIRTPEITDANPIYNLICESRPLDINSLYSYLLICTHFNQTSVVAELNGNILGYVSAYVNPNSKDSLFIWQVAVNSTIRSTGLATRMINDIMGREELHNIKFIETTVTPSNKASMALFQKIALLFKTKCEKTPFFTEDLFGKSGHEEELLLRIGPIR